MAQSKFDKTICQIPLATYIITGLSFYLLFTRIAAAVEDLGKHQQPFTAEDCTQITANGTCICYRDKHNLTNVECVAEQIHISLNEDNGVKLTCGGGVLKPDVLASLPHLGKLRETAEIATYNCLPVTELLAQLALTPSYVLDVRGLASVAQVSLETFGRDLERLRKIKELELHAEPQQSATNDLQLVSQQLSPDILEPMPSLFRITIDLNFAHLPTDLFSPVPNINSIALLGQLEEFPSSAFHGLRRLRELDMQQHRLLHRLREDDFKYLTTIRGLYLTNCSITELPARIFAPLILLQRLGLKDNQLRVLPTTLLAQQKRLQILNLSGNLLEALPVGLFATTTRLLTLFLSRNRLRHLDAKVLPPLNTFIELSVDNNELRTIAAGTFAQPNRLQLLDLRNNQLDWAAGEDCAIFEGLWSLKRLLLSNNSLHYLCDQLGSSNHSTSALFVIDVRQNQLKHISPQLINTLNTSETMTFAYLSENPWACNCSTQPLLNFVKSNRKRLSDASDMRCENTKLARLLELSFTDFCLPEMGVRTVLVIVVVCVAALGLAFTTTALCYYKYRIELKIWLYTHRLCMCCVSEKDVDRDRKWDAFISYSHHDEQFVENELVPGLEQGQPSFKVCIHVRDWLAGGYIPEQIIDSVEQSRRTIIVLSQHFIESDWAQMEFRTAHQCAVNEGRSRIILVIYGEIKVTELLDQELKAYLKMNTYLKWGDPWFWQKLRYAMPHAQRGKWKFRGNSSKIECNVELSEVVENGK
ncbi:toll-like receptor Tollo [Anastrepha obliqua]|uniref:toll-like receptor Tollo n=1 Tax=Anastrepha obliqua TaxID=95512 RepID=UPI0024094755|nr:toll-like receptor Tollo [Anastrepha obliqua]